MDSHVTKPAPNIYVVYLISKSDSIAQVKKESSHNGASRKKKLIKARKVFVSTFIYQFE